MAPRLRCAALWLACLAMGAIPLHAAAADRDDLPLRDGIAYYQQIASLHQWLGIPSSVAGESRLGLQTEAAALSPIGSDPYGRQHYLAPEVATAWHELRRAARAEGVEFVVISSFRSAEYQARLIRERLDDGRSAARVLRAMALPGYSEHHSGCALDLASRDRPRLSADFRDTAAYAWLRAHGEDFGFRESYPADNDTGIVAEPWHWFYQGCRHGAGAE